MEIRQLRYVLAVVDHGGFTRAAAAEHIAQPSLSQAVRSLERELGVELFHRLGRRVALTPAGEAFIGPARQVLRDLATVRAVVADVQGLRAGHLDLVALPTLAVEPLAGLLGRFRHDHPGLTVRVAEPEDVGALSSLVQLGQAELGLTELPPSDPALEQQPMGSQEILAVRPPGTRHERGRRLAVSALEGVPLVTTPPGTSTRELVEQALARAGISPLVAVEVGQREALLPLVLAGAGTSFLPRPLARHAARRGAVVLPLDPPVVRRIGLVHRRGALSPAARAFLALALDPGTSPSRARNPLPDVGSVLVVCAHPDDESFGLGAVLSTLADAATPISVLCLTHGEASTLHGVPGDLAAIRARELAAAARVLGVGRAELLDYPDGGLDAQPLPDLAGHVRRAARAAGASSLLVFDQGGVTGHPDHQRATLAALAAADAEDLQVLAWAVPDRVAAELNAGFGTRFVGRSDDDLDVTVRVDRHRQREAIACHASQASGNPVLWRRLELLGDTEHLRWLRRARPDRR